MAPNKAPLTHQTPYAEDDQFHSFVVENPTDFGSIDRGNNHKPDAHRSEN